MTYWQPDPHQDDYEHSQETPTQHPNTCQHNLWVTITPNTNHLKCRYCHQTQPLPQTWHRNHKTRLQLQPQLTRYTTPHPGLSSGTGYIRKKAL